LLASASPSQATELGFKEHRAIGMLLMTLPRLIEVSLRQRTGNSNFEARLSGWQLASRDSV
jgi:hypothetical protein